MQFTTVRSKEKDYDIYLKSEKLVHSQQEHEKKCFPAIWKWEKLVPSYLEREIPADKHCCSYFTARERKKCDSPDKHYFERETKKCSSQLLGARKKIMTSI